MNPIPFEIDYAHSVDLRDSAGNLRGRAVIRAVGQIDEDGSVNGEAVVQIDDFGGILAPAVFGEVLCVVDARGDLRLKFQRVDGQNTFDGEGYVAAGIGKCEPETWAEWDTRWWGDKWCYQAGAMLDVSYDVGGWDLGYDLDHE